MEMLRLLLRSVYLRGQCDANRKTSSMDWEDKIVSDITKIFSTALDTKQEKCPACHNILSVKEGRNTCVQCGRTGTMGEGK